MLDPALAYIDPGSGTILLQIMIGCLIGTTVYFREAFRRVFRVFKRS